MKLDKLLTLTLLFLVAFAFLSSAAEDDPPVLDNHQFYGTSIVTVSSPNVTMSGFDLYGDVKLEFLAGTFNCR